MSGLKFRLALFFLLICSISSAYRQPSNTDSVKQKSVLSPGDFNSFEKDQGKSADKILDSLKWLAGNEGIESSPEYRKAYLEYQLESLDHRHRVFEWQLTSSKYIFITVITIVGLGLLLSFWQFYLPIYRENRAAKKIDIQETRQVVGENTEIGASTIKLGKGGIEITSSVIGLLILFISIAFFFLYLQYVYPISEIQP